MKSITRGAAGSGPGQVDDTDEFKNDPHVDIPDTDKTETKNVEDNNWGIGADPENADGTNKTTTADSKANNADDNDPFKSDKDTETGDIEI